MLPLAIALNSEPVKYAIIACTAPLWIPFFKALWHTLNDGLREEGGLLGRPPNAEQLAALEKLHGPASASLISVPREGPIGASGPTKGSARGAGRSGGGSRAAPAAAPGRPGRPPRQGFR